MSAGFAAVLFLAVVLATAAATTTTARPAVAPCFASNVQRNRSVYGLQLPDTPPVVAWQLPGVGVGPVPVTGCATNDGQAACVTAAAGSSQTLLLANASTGAVVWRIPLNNSGLYTPLMSAFGDVVACDRQRVFVTALDGGGWVDTVPPSPLWPGCLSPAFMDSGAALVFVGSKVVYTDEPSNGTPIAAVTLGDDAVPHPDLDTVAAAPATDAASSRAYIPAVSHAADGALVVRLWAWQAHASMSGRILSPWNVTLGPCAPAALTPGAVHIFTSELPSQVPGVPGAQSIIMVATPTRNGTTLHVVADHGTHTATVAAVALDAFGTVASVASGEPGEVWLSFTDNPKHLARVSWPGPSVTRFTAPFAVTADVGVVGSAVLLAGGSQLAALHRASGKLLWTTTVPLASPTAALRGNVAVPVRTPAALTLVLQSDDGGVHGLAFPQGNSEQ